MNKIFERRNFSETSIPKWPCPSCDQGFLAQQQDKFDYQNDAMTKRECNSDYFEPYHYKFVFTCMMECQNCAESVSIIGTGGVSVDQPHDGPPETNEYFTPKFFQPALQIINLPANPDLPEKVRELLNASFSLFWCDYDACANRIRATLEILLDAMGIPRKLDENVKKELTLHQRIERIVAPDGSEKNEIKQMIEALKWQGNAGSHELEGINHQQLLQSYEMIEFCLHSLYPEVDDRRVRLLEIAKKINAKNRK